MGANEIIPADKPKEKKVGFWEKQTPDELSKKQKWFDLIFGVILPIVFLYFEPIVRSDGLWGDYRLFANLAISIGIIFLLLQLYWPKRFQEFQAVKTGVLFIGGMFALLLGIVMLPLSLLGIGFFWIGLLGLFPFFTAFVFLRNSDIALSQALKTSLNFSRLITGIVVGIILALGVPGIIQFGTTHYVDKSIEMVINGDIEEGNQGVRRLQWAFWCSTGCYDDIVWAYREEWDKSRKEYLLDVYEDLTGEDLQDQLWILMD
jgi:hypothetical protein